VRRAHTSLATMPDGGGRAHFVLTQGGSQALGILKTDRVGHVAAVFERSFYAAFHREWICFGTESLPMGPLNVRTSAPEDVIRTGRDFGMNDPVRSSAGLLRIGREIAFGLGNAVVWDPPEAPSWTAARVKAGLDALGRLVKPGADGGLGGFVRADWPLIARDRVDAAARRHIDVLCLAAEHAFRDVSPEFSEIDGAATALLGLGPGLTPSGDDFLGGMLIALHILKGQALRAALNLSIERHAGQRTNAISFAHLRAAGAGAGHEALHEVLNCLLGAHTDMLPAHLSAIDDIGHSSGWDALAGMCVTLRAYLAAQRPGG